MKKFNLLQKTPFPLVPTLCVGTQKLLLPAFLRSAWECRQVLMMNRYIIVLILSLFLISCTKEPEIGDRATKAQVSPLLIASWIIEGRNDFTLVDLRSKEEFEKGSLPGAIHMTLGQITDPEIVAGLPEYKKIVFFSKDGNFDGNNLLPLFAKGLHVMLIENGYSGWNNQVLKGPPRSETVEEKRRDAIAKFFRGESILGTPKTLQKIPAQSLIRKPTFKKKKKKQANEGC